MNKKKNLIFFLILILLVNCSFDNKTGIWGGDKKEKRRIAELEKKQNQKIYTDKIYSSEKNILFLYINGEAEFFGEEYLFFPIFFLKNLLSIPDK